MCKTRIHFFRTAIEAEDAICFMRRREYILPHNGGPEYRRKI